MTLEPGSVVEGKVINITSFGAFIEIEGKTGMVHISEVANGYIKDINEVLKPGDVVKVKIISIEPNGKMSLSIKQAAHNDGVQAERPARNFRERRNDREFRDSERESNGFRRNDRIDGGSFSDDKKSAPASFEEMMKSFQKVSEERVAEYKRRAEGINNKKRRS